MGYTLAKARGLLYLLLRIAINRGMVSVAPRAHTAVAGSLLLPWWHRGLMELLCAAKARTHGRSRYSTLAMWQRGVKEYSVQLKSACTRPYLVLYSRHKAERSKYTLSPAPRHREGLHPVRMQHVATPYSLPLNPEKKSKRWGSVRVGRSMQP